MSSLSRVICQHDLDMLFFFYFTGASSALYGEFIPGLFNLFHVLSVFRKSYFESEEGPVPKYSSLLISFLIAFELRYEATANFIFL